jgi:hypothetical protein
MDFMCGIDGDLVVITEGTHRLDMVCVVVGDEHMMNLRKIESVGTEIFLQAAQTDSKVYQQGIVWSGQQVAVTTASTTERDEFHHTLMPKFVQRYKKVKK